MAREDGRGSAVQRRTPAERRRARRWAMHSSERLASRMSARLCEAREAVEAVLGEGNTELLRRLLLAAPVLARQVEGEEPTGVQVLKRNCAMHAAILPGPEAPLSAWSRAQRGPRLGAGTHECTEQGNEQ